MKRLIKTFPDGSFLEYNRGRFDEWCVYLTRPGAHRVAPRDYQYFQVLKALSEKYTANKIYCDFVRIYEQTGKHLNQQVLHLISDISYAYTQDALLMDIEFTTIYAGMVAEENKANTKLGKKVKRLGVYQVVIENLSAEYAASYSKGKKWYDITSACKQRGF